MHQNLTPSGSPSGRSAHVQSTPRPASRIAVRLIGAEVVGRRRGELCSTRLYLEWPRQNFNKDSRRLQVSRERRGQRCFDSVISRYVNRIHAIHAVRDLRELAGQAGPPAPRSTI